MPNCSYYTLSLNPAKPKSPCLFYLLLINWERPWLKTTDARGSVSVVKATHQMSYRLMVLVNIEQLKFNFLFLEFTHQAQPGFRKTIQAVFYRSLLSFFTDKYVELRQVS